MDLSILPDDQLLQLIEAVTKEVARRAIAIQAATNKYWQEAKEEILDNINDRQAPIDNDCTKATVISLLKNLDFFRAYKYDSFSLSIWEKNAIAFMRKLATLGCGSTFVRDLGKGHMELSATIERLILPPSRS